VGIYTEPLLFTTSYTGSTQSCMTWFKATAADDSCIIPQPGCTLLSPERISVTYFSQHTHTHTHTHTHISQPLQHQCITCHLLIS